MARVTLPFLLPSTNTQPHFIGKPVVVVLIDSGGNADQICLRLSGLAWMFSLSLSPVAHTIACNFRSACSAFEEEMRNY